MLRLRSLFVLLALSPFAHAQPSPTAPMPLDLVTNAVRTPAPRWKFIEPKRYREMPETIALQVTALAAHAAPEAEIDGQPLAEHLAAKLRTFLVTPETYADGSTREPEALGGISGWTHHVPANALLLAKRTPAVWSRMSDDEKARADLLMQALALAGHWCLDDDNTYYVLMDGETLFHRSWNPNHVEGYVGVMVAASLYFGHEELNTFFRRFDFDHFAARLEGANFRNILRCWTWTPAVRDRMMFGGDLAVPDHQTLVPGVVTTGRGVRNEFTYDGMGLDEPWALYRSQAMRVFSKAVRNSVNIHGDLKGEILGRDTGATTSPWNGQTGFIFELESMDWTGLRTNTAYAYEASMIDLMTATTLKQLGEWQVDAGGRPLERRMAVGMADFARRHGIRLLLLESFVERGRFRGSCYQAANWLHAGVTRGRGRNDRLRQAGLPLKDIWLQPLEKDALRLLRAGPGDEGVREHDRSRPRLGDRSGVEVRPDTGHGRAEDRLVGAVDGLVCELVARQIRLQVGDAVDVHRAELIAQDHRLRQAVHRGPKMQAVGEQLRSEAQADRRVVVAGTDDDRAQLREADQGVLEQRDGLDRGQRAVVDVAADEDGVHLLPVHDIGDEPDGRALVLQHRHALQRHPQMPVGRVEQSHVTPHEIRERALTREGMPALRQRRPRRAPPVFPLPARCMRLVPDRCPPGMAGRAVRASAAAPRRSGAVGDCSDRDAAGPPQRPSGSGTRGGRRELRGAGADAPSHRLVPGIGREHRRNRGGSQPQPSAVGQEPPRRCCSHGTPRKTTSSADSADGASRGTSRRSTPGGCGRRSPGPPSSRRPAWRRCRRRPPRRRAGQPGRSPR